MNPTERYILWINRLQLLLTPIHPCEIRAVYSAVSKSFIQ